MASARGGRGKSSNRAASRDDAFSPVFSEFGSNSSLNYAPDSEYDESPDDRLHASTYTSTDLSAAAAAAPASPAEFSAAAALLQGQVAQAEKIPPRTHHRLPTPVTTTEPNPFTRRGRERQLARDRRKATATHSPSDLDSAASATPTQQSALTAQIQNDKKSYGATAASTPITFLTHPSKTQHSSSYSAGGTSLSKGTPTLVVRSPSGKFMGTLPLGASVRLEDVDHDIDSDRLTAANKPSNSIVFGTSTSVNNNERDVEQGMSASTPLISHSAATSPSAWSTFQDLTLVRYIILALIYIGSVATAAPTAMNATTSPSGIDPKDLNEKWWPSMDALTKVHSIANGASSLSINTILSAAFFKLAYTKVKTALIEAPKSALSFTSTAVAFILALASAAAAFMIALNSFSFLGKIWSLIPAVFSFLTTSTQRVVAVLGVFTRAKNYFSKEAEVQSTYLQALKHFDRSYEAHLSSHQRLESKFNNKKAVLLDARNTQGKSLRTPWTQEENEKLLIEICDALSKYPADVLRETPFHETLATAAGSVFDYTLATSTVMPTAIVHMDKGIDFLNAIRLLTHDDKIQSTTPLFVLMGTLPALASVMLYFLSALEIRSVMFKTLEYLYKNPDNHHATTRAANIIFFFALLGANGLASGGMQSVAEGIVGNPTNPFGIKPGDFATAFVILMTIAGLIVNLCASLKWAFTPNPKTPENTTIDDIIAHTEQHLISPKTAKALASQSIYKRKVDTTARQQEEAAARAHATEGCSTPYFVAM